VIDANSGVIPGAKLVIDGEALQQLIDALVSRGYRVIAPTMRSGAIAYDSVTRLEELPIGWTDRQEAGTYHLEPRDDDAVFGYAVGSHSWKQFLHPPVEQLWQARRDGNGFAVSACEPAPEPLAFIGVRACELHAIAIQDRVFVEGPYHDRRYQWRRGQAFIVAVNCSNAGGTCFCASMETGPEVTAGFDLALTELLDDGNHSFLLEIGSATGVEVAGTLPHRPATAAEIEAAARVVARTRNTMGRTLDTTGLKEALQNNPEHPRWEEVAARCLACANCTMVCPTCFCTTVDDTTDLTGSVVERTRRWDSCFTLDFSYIHGGSVRQSTRARYRQWMTHKLANWLDQFGSSGCVGCGRCITWCPVGIDITDLASGIRDAVFAEQSHADRRS
jgi:sulfhydrogenase subunit beta (sulfur reductase)